MALALYRKYRPRTFAEVIGQEQVTEPLSQALRSGRLHHAYLFSGPRGCGKTSSARILARSLNCEQGPTPEPCGTCQSCRSLATDGAGSVDVIEIDAASHGGVDDARELRERAFFAPVGSRFKIYVIDEAHMVSAQGFNALLKLVEEPPDYVKFIFATTEPEKVLGTIKSRTHHYPFRLIPPGVLRPYLEQLTAAEGVKVEPSVFPLVVRAGGGSARDTLSVLDQLIAGAGPEGVSYARAVALLGVTDSALIDEMCDALAAGDGSAMYGTVDRVAEAGHDPRRFAADLLERLRDLIILRQVPDAAAKGLIDGPADQIERMTAQAERLGPATLSRCADIVHNGLVEMRGATAPRLLLELICARMLLPGAEDSTGALLQRLEQVERRVSAGGGHALSATVGAERPAAVPDRPASTPPPAAAPADRPASAPPSARRPAPPEAVMPDPATPEPPSFDAAPGQDAVSGQLDAAAVRRSWGEVVGFVNRSNKRIAALMRDAVVRDLNDDTLVLTVKSPVLAQMLSAQLDLLTGAVYEVLGGRWQIRCEASGDQRRSGGAERSARSGPGRSTRAAGTGGNSSGGASAADSDWPEAARPGGAAAPAGRTGTAGTTRSAGTTSSDSSPATGPDPARPGGAPVSTARSTAASRPANSTKRAPGAPPTAGAAQPTAGAPADSGRARAGAGGQVADRDWAGDPPYDPEFDAPAGGVTHYEGFDPGDEPLDEVIDERTARQTSEQQAVQLLQEALGAEKIGEVDSR